MSIPFPLKKRSELFVGLCSDCAYWWSLDRKWGSCDRVVPGGDDDNSSKARLVGSNYSQYGLETHMTFGCVEFTPVDK